MTTLSAKPLKLKAAFPRKVASQHRHDNEENVDETEDEAVEAEDLPLEPHGMSKVEGQHRHDNYEDEDEAVEAENLLL